MLEKIKSWLSSNGVTFTERHHEPTLTSEDSARARGEELRVGGKALLIKVDETFKLFVISAAQKLDSKKIRQHFNAKKSRFASKEELQEKTGLVPGSVPPFGAPILPFELYIDISITSNERIAFNAGSLTDSLILSVPDYLRVAGGQIFQFSE
jgi:prolyl-tRNA editing enzyme YbaK/EbsC (Cys-tRNA(Pro) deacylase)